MQQGILPIACAVVVEARQALIVAAISDGDVHRSAAACQSQSQLTKAAAMTSTCTFNLRPVS